MAGLTPDDFMGPADPPPVRTYTARFDSECAACGGAVFEGDEYAWLDGEVVHPQCAESDGDYF